MALKIYRISQTANNGYDTYDAAVVVAATHEAARFIHPDGFGATWHQRYGCWRSRADGWELISSTWCNPDQVMVEEIGTADSGVEAGVVLASFHAG